MTKQNQTQPPRRHIGLAVGWTYGYFRGVLRGIGQYAQSHGDWCFSLLMNANTSELLLSPKAGLDGIVVQISTPAQVSSLLTASCPVVSVSNCIVDCPFPLVTQDDWAVGTLAAEYLLGRGYRNLAYTGIPWQAFSVQRQRAFETAGRNAGAIIHESIPMHQDCEAWLRKLPKFSAVFCATDWGALDLMEIARQAAVQIPESIAVLGGDNDEFQTVFARPSLSSIAIPTERIGFEAARLLDRLMSGATLPTAPICLPPIGVVTRRSTSFTIVEDPIVAEALRFLDAHANSFIGIKDVLQAICVSRTALETRFRKAIGRTPWEELTRIRIERIKHLLASTDIPLREVAGRCGLPSDERLSVIFKREVGQTPREFRRLVRVTAY